MLLPVHIYFIPIWFNPYMAMLAIPWLLQEVTEDSLCNIEPDMLQGLTEWMQVGGDSSIAEFRGLSPEEQEAVLEYLSEFALYDVVEAGGKEFVLVHAGLDNFSPDRPLETYDLSEVLFHKPDYETPYFPDKYLVTGHTPTRAAYAAQRGLPLEKLQPSEYEDRIFQKNRHIAIDCAAGFGGKLGCICLNTLEAYYV